MLKLSRNGLRLQSLTSLDESQGSSNVKVSIQNDGTYTNYSTQLHYGYYVHGFSYTKGIARYENGVFILPREAFEQYGLLNLSVLLVSSDEELMTNQVQFIVQAAPRGDMVIDDIPSAQQQVLQLVQTTLDQYANTINLNKNEIAVLKSRMDSFTSLQQGSTTGDAELIDGRVGYDGKTYKNIGGAIRGQVSQLSDDIGDILYKNENEILVDNYVYVKVINTQNGNILNYKGCYSETYFPVNYGDTVYFWTKNKSDITTARIYLYDSNKKFISANLAMTISIPNNCHYVRISIFSEGNFENKIVFSKENRFPKWFIFNNKCISENMLITSYYQIINDSSHFIYRYINFDTVTSFNQTKVVGYAEESKRIGVFVNLSESIDFVVKFSNISDGQQVSINKVSNAFNDEVSLIYNLYVTNGEVTIKSSELPNDTTKLCITVLNDKTIYDEVGIELLVIDNLKEEVKYFHEHNKTQDIAIDANKKDIEFLKSTINVSKKYKLITLGDSITALGVEENGWIKYFLEKVNCELVENVAVPGATLYDYSDTVYDGNPTQTSNNTLGNQVQKIINNNYESPDIIIIAIGTNGGISITEDQMYNTYVSKSGLIPLQEVDKKTSSGAFRYAHDKLKELYPNSIIFWCAPIFGAIDKRNHKSILSYAKSLEIATSFASTPFVDTFRCGINGFYEQEGSRTYLGDGIHPNEEGAKKIGYYNATKIKPYLL